MRTKRAWSRGEKTLLLVPLLVIALAFGLWRWEQAAPLIIKIDGISGNGEVAFSPDGKRVAVLHEVYVLSTMVTDVAIFDAHTGQLQTHLKNPNPKNFLGCIAWSPDASRLATITGRARKNEGFLVIKGKAANFNSYKVALWDSSGAQIRTFPLAAANEYAIPDLAWTRDGKLWNLWQPPTLYDAETGKRSTFMPPVTDLHQLKRHYFNANHSLLATEEKTGIVIREVPSGRLLRTVARPPGTVAIWVPPNSDVLVIRSLGNAKKDALMSEKTRFLNLRTGQVLSAPPVTSTRQIVFASQSRVAIVDARRRPGAKGVDSVESWESCRLMMWDFTASKVLWQIALKSYQTNGSAYEELSGLSASPDGRRLTALIRTTTPDAEGMYLPKISLARVIWDVATGREIWRAKLDVTPNITGAENLQWSADGKSIAIYPTPQGIQIYHLPD